LQDKFGFIDIVVNNAGCAFTVSDPTPFSDQARQSVDVNYYGTRNMMANFLPLMNKGGKFIAVSSRAGYLSSWSADKKSILTSDDLTFDKLDEAVEMFVDKAKTGQHAEEGYGKSAYGSSKGDHWHIPCIVL
jgi:carbonyl reductase 1